MEIYRGHSGIIASLARGKGGKELRESGGRAEKEARDEQSW